MAQGVVVRASRRGGLPFKERRKHRMWVHSIVLVLESLHFHLACSLPLAPASLPDCFPRGPCDQSPSSSTLTDVGCSSSEPFLLVSRSTNRARRPFRRAPSRTHRHQGRRFMVLFFNKSLSWPSRRGRMHVTENVEEEQARCAQHRGLRQH